MTQVREIPLARSVHRRPPMFGARERYILGSHCGDVELLALVLGTMAGGRGTREVAGELIDRFNQESATPHRRLTNREPQDLLRPQLSAAILIKEQLLQRVLDDALSQDLRSVEAR